MIVFKIAYNLGIMQLAMLAPYSNLATSVAATLVPTLLGAKIKSTEENEPANTRKSAEEIPAEEGNVYTSIILIIDDSFRVSVCMRA